MGGKVLLTETLLITGQYILAYIIDTSTSLIRVIYEIIPILTPKKLLVFKQSCT